MTDLATAQERLEAAILQLEQALDTQGETKRTTAKDAKSLRERNEAVSRRLEAAIDRLQTLLGA